MSLGKALDSAKWVVAPKKFASPTIIRKFIASADTSANIAISSLGFFALYLNGKRVGRERFLPLHSIYRDIGFDQMEYPIYDKFTFRAYYSVFDITEYLVSGENTLEIRLGNGFYRQSERIAEGDWRYGDALGVRYAISLLNNGEEDFVLSDCSEIARDSEIRYSELFVGEIYDARIARNKAYTYAKTSEILLPDTVLTPADAPADTVAGKIIPKLISRNGERSLYDAGANISGLVRVRAFPKEGERVVIRYAEEIKNGELDFITAGSDYVCRSGRNQIMEDVFIGDGDEHFYEPTFVWHAFRYFEITGSAEADCVSIIHTEAPVTSSFNSSSQELNWLYDAFIRTQLNNMHLGFPSDCPHRERLGYTGDGQICSLAAMTLIDSRRFYRKWIRDIFDSQDKLYGHVSHTAPFAGGGGGPVGWGGAAITVPYNYYKAFGDKAPLYENYEGMKKYLNYLMSRSDGGLVTREETGGWVLGDWCTLDECKIPVPLVNTALLIKYLGYLEEVAAAVNRNEDIPKFKEIKAHISNALKEKYFDPSTGSFSEGIQGADAYGIYASTGDERTFCSLVDKYESLGHFDTGFIGTYVLLDVLFGHGAENTAYKLLAGHDLGSFGYMMDRGASTVWEHWRGEGSHDHPMFGASSVYLFSHILGIGQTADSYGYDRILISPKIPDGLESVSGSIATVRGRISVTFERRGNRAELTVELPEGVSAELRFRGINKILTQSITLITYEEQKK